MFWNFKLTILALQIHLMRSASTLRWKLTNLDSGELMTYHDVDALRTGNDAVEPVTNSLKYKFEFQIQVDNCQVNDRKNTINTDVIEGFTRNRHHRNDQSDAQFTNGHVHPA
jgi:hypothetical protein